ncbi:MAG TPA: pantoate--beta-alanine ligase [Thermodesulfobacteriota bacterium]|nr:pantoate--beta-alanine ligase [Thermodesulfobacteriota bacterium]
MRLITSIPEMKAFSTEARKEGRTIAFVPTMGYLHEGHRRLLIEAKKLGDATILSVFVNPSQFGANEDFAKYPRDMERDKAIAVEHGAEVLFAPEVFEMYPKGYGTFVDVPELADKLCGKSRPGHFRAVATIVAKFFNIVMPHKAIFGLKDYQQWLIIKKMVKDTDMDVEVVAVETVREADGLAMSSRNVYLSASERRAAAIIPKAMAAAREAVIKGERRGAAIEEIVKKIMEKEPSAVIDYVSVCDTDNLDGVEVIQGRALLAMAIRIGKARLIDNCLLSV